MLSPYSSSPFQLDFLSSANNYCCRAVAIWQQCKRPSRKSRVAPGWCPNGCPVRETAGNIIWKWLTQKPPPADMLPPSTFSPSNLCPLTGQAGRCWLQLLQEHYVGMRWTRFPLRHLTAKRDQESAAGTVLGLARLRSTKCVWTLTNPGQNSAPLSPPVLALPGPHVPRQKGMLETSKGSGGEGAWLTTAAPNSTNGRNREHGGNRAAKINSSTLEEVLNILELAAGQLFWKTF